MRQVTVAATIADGDNFNTVPVVLDQYIAPFQVTFTTSPEATGVVQVTYDAPYPVSNGNFVEQTFNWVTAPTGAPNADGFLGQPFRAIRLAGANENDELTVIQAGI